MYVPLMLSLCSYQNRLLHPGASTADILSQYISTMKSLHVVDPSGAAAERVCQPVQAYLRCGVLLGATLAGSGGNTLSCHAALQLSFTTTYPYHLCYTEPEKTLCDALWPASLTTQEVTWLMWVCSDTALWK